MTQPAMRELWITVRTRSLRRRRRQAAPAAGWRGCERMADRTHPGEIGSASGACCSTRKAAAAPEARSELVRPCCVVQGLRRAASSVDQPKEERTTKSGRSRPLPPPPPPLALCRALCGKDLCAVCSPNVSK